MSLQMSQETDHPIPELIEQLNAEPVDPLTLRDPWGPMARLLIDARRPDAVHPGYIDGMTLANAPGKLPFSDILTAYNKQTRLGNTPGADFFGQHFDTDGTTIMSERAPDGMTTYEYAAGANLSLVRERRQDQGPHLALPYPFPVPGDRFMSSFPADNYAVARGNIETGDWDGVRRIIGNATYQIMRYGFEMNANMRPMAGRSQLPYFSFLIEEAARHFGPQLLIDAQPVLERSLEFWSSGQQALKQLPPGQTGAHRRMVRMPNGAMMYRFYDDSPIGEDGAQEPRIESFLEDTITVERATHGLEGEAKNLVREKLLRSIMAACESTQDFADRWMVNGTYESMRTVDIVPVELNTNMVHLMLTLAASYRASGNPEKAEKYQTDADKLSDAINHYMFDARMFSESDGLQAAYRDVTVDGQQTHALTVGMSQPLHVPGITSYEQAMAVTRTMEQQLLRHSGFVTSLVESGQQWDAPNVWPMSNMVAIESILAAGLDAKRQGMDGRYMIDVAIRAREALLSAIERGFGKFRTNVEKYHADNPDKLSSGGEYPLQTGFGMTNGAALALKNRNFATEHDEYEVNRRAGSLLVARTVIE